MPLDPDRPVLAGVGTCFDDVEALELMIRATTAAGEDAAGDAAAALLSKVDRIVVPRGTWSYADPARAVADAIGAPEATTVLVEVGIPQQTIIDEALALIADGTIDVCVVVGAEAKARAARAKQRSTRGDAAGMADLFTNKGTAEAIASETDQGDIEPDVLQSPSEFLIDPAELDAGLFAPVDQYAMIENALGAAEGRTPDEVRDDVADLMARCNQVAQSNPHAAFPAPMTATDLRTFSEGNRPLAFPYAKWHVTQWTVDQAAALVLCRASVAEAAGVDLSRCLVPEVGLSSSLTVPLSQRADLHRWPAMQVLGAAAGAHLGAPLTDCGIVELYSCFPVAIRVQQRELGLPLDGTPTVTGGMSFGGGPFNSFVIQSLAEVAARLRDEGGRALVTSVSGMLTKPGLGVWTTDADPAPLLVADLVDDATAATDTVTVAASHEGDATVVSWTVTHQGLEPHELVVLAATPDARVIARTTDAGLVARGVRESLVGRTARIAGNDVVSID